MRRIKISKLNIASINETGLKKSIKNVFNISDNSQYGFKLKNNTGIVQVGDMFFEVKEKDIFLNEYKKSLYTSMKKEFEKVPPELQEAIEMNNLSPLNLANDFVENFVDNNPKYFKVLNSILDQENEIVYSRIKNNKEQFDIGEDYDILGTQDINDDSKENVKKFREENINKDAVETNQLIDDAKEKLSTQSIERLKKSIFDLYEKYKGIILNANNRLKTSQDKYEKEELTEIIRMSKELFIGLKEWKNAIEKDPELSFLFGKERFLSRLTEEISNALGKNISQEDIVYEPKRVIIKNKKYLFLEAKETILYIERIYKSDVSKLKREINSEFKLDLSNEIDRSFKLNNESMNQGLSINLFRKTPYVDLDKIEFNDREKREIIKKYKSLDRHFLIEE